MNPKTILCILILLVLANFCFAADAPPARESEFKSIFDGKDLATWQGDPVVWSARDGVIHATLPEFSRNKNGSLLVWRGGNVDDFELRFSCRFVDLSSAALGNLNVKYRTGNTPADKAYWYVLDIDDRGAGRGRVMEVGDRGVLSKRGKKTVARNGNGPNEVEVIGTVTQPANIQAAYKKNDWNEVAIIAEGNHLVHLLNGVVTADFIDENEAKRHRSGSLALKVWLARGPGMDAEFKNLRLRRIQNGKIVSAPPAAESKPPSAGDKAPAAERLKKVKALYDQGLINKEDYDKKVKEIMDSF